MKTVLALALLAYTDVASASLSCGGCYDSTTHVVTCATAKPSDCMYWYSGYGCTTIGYTTDADTCAAEYDVTYGKDCIEGATRARTLSIMTPHNRRCCYRSCQVTWLPPTALRSPTRGLPATCALALPPRIE